MMSRISMMPMMLGEQEDYEDSDGPGAKHRDEDDLERRHAFSLRVVGQSTPMWMWLGVPYLS